MNGGYKFNDEWLFDERFKKWIQKSDDGKVHCKFCNCNLNAKKSTIIDHMTSAKHKKYDLEERSYSESTVIVEESAERNDGPS